MQRLLRLGALRGNTPSLRRQLATQVESMALIKELRQQTGAPLVDVKKALVAADWKLDLALEDLQKRGLNAAAKKASRTAAEGLVCVKVQGLEAAVVEINSETDFVARSAPFQSLIHSVAASALLRPSPARSANGRLFGDLPKEELEAQAVTGKGTVKDAVVAVAAEVRENVLLRRAFRATFPPGSVVGTYMHGGPAPGLGRICGIVALQPGGAAGDAASATKAQQLAQQLAMHIIASKPLVLESKDAPEQGLLDQRFAVDESRSVREALGPAKVLDFVRVETGEGVARGEAKDFAEEVRAMSGVGPS